MANNTRVLYTSTMSEKKNPKIALVCDWLTNFGGAERVILALHEMYPQAPIYTSIYNPAKMQGFENAYVVPSFLQKLPKAKTKWQLYLPWMPFAFEQFDLSEYDVVLSSCHSCSKGVLTLPQTKHICYCHTPMRYVWDNFHQYIKEAPYPGIMKKLGQHYLHKIRMWDRLAAERVDEWYGNSKYICSRIKKYYQKDAKHLYPPVNTSMLGIANKVGNYYLALGRLISYKRFDIVVEAFNELGLPLLIAGTGPEESKLKKMAKPNITFLGRVPDYELKDLYSHCKAFIFPPLEDFGIVPLEAQACGRPVIAYRAGGSMETVKEGFTGEFIDEQNTAALVQALKKFQPNKYDPQKVRKWAMEFSAEKFKERVREIVNSEK